MDDLTDYNSTSNLMENIFIDNINYKLLNCIQNNKIDDIITIFENHKNKICYWLKDSEKNSLLMIAIKHIKQMTVNKIQCICPFIYTVNYTIMDIAHLLINEYTINNQNLYGDSPLTLLIQQIDPKKNNNTIYELIHLLIKNNIDTNIQDLDGYTPLMLCVKLLTKQNEYHMKYVLKLLLKNTNTNVNVISNNGEHILTMLVDKTDNFISLIKLLINYNAEIPTTLLPIHLNLLLKLNIAYILSNNPHKFNNIKKHYMTESKNGNRNALESLFYYYDTINRPDLIDKDDYQFIVSSYEKIRSFILLYKSPLHNEFGECGICLEGMSNITSLPCHNEHKICVECIEMLKQKICPFCRELFFIKETK